MKKIYLLLLVVFALSGCEKDDICDANTPTTPRLVIEFYDVANPAVLKNVTNLKVIGPDNEEGVILNETATIEELKYISNANRIAIPLNPLTLTSELNLILNFGNSNEALVLTDNLKFNYTTRDEFVSRACGFKTLYTLNPTSNTLFPIILNDNANVDQGNWIKDIEILQSNIDTENEVHVKIYF